MKEWQFFSEILSGITNFISETSEKGSVINSSMQTIITQLDSLQNENKNLETRRSSAIKNFDELFSATEKVNTQIDSMINTITNLAGALNQAQDAEEKTKVTINKLTALVGDDKTKALT